MCCTRCFCNKKKPKEKFMENKRKIGKILYLLPLTIVLIATLYMIILRSDNDTVIADEVTDLVFSYESGFYESPIDLTISSAESAVVYYTLDGSTPTTKSFVYEKPIHLEDASDNPNVYSLRKDVSVAFNTELIEKYSSEPSVKYAAPTKPVDKCNVVRAMAVYPDGKCSEVKTASYFVGFDDKEGYEGMNFLSVVVDPYDLFDYENGMYVTGKTFDDYVENILGTGKDGDNVLWPFWYSNYSKGYHEEKKASCQFFSTDRKLRLSQNCGTKIHGNSSRFNNPKSLNLYARDEYGPYDNFAYRLFDSEYYPKRVTVFNGGQDDASKIEDYLVTELWKNLDFSRMEFEPYVMFLDGEYWGVYWLTEKYDKEYLQAHYNVDPDNVVLVRNGAIEYGTDEDVKYYTEFLDFIMDNDLNTEENYQKFVDMIDLDSFLDYYGALIYVNRAADWPMSNTGLWRSKDITGGRYNDGKWRWMFFDVNTRAFYEFPDVDGYDFAMMDDMFAKLMTCDKLRNQLLDRIIELDENTFKDETVEKEIAAFRQLMDEPMKKNNERFRGEGSYSLYENHIAEIESYLKRHHEVIFQMVEKHR